MYEYNTCMHACMHCMQACVYRNAFMCVCMGMVHVRILCVARMPCIRCMYVMYVRLCMYVVQHMYASSACTCACVHACNVCNVGMYACMHCMHICICMYNAFVCDCSACNCVCNSCLHECVYVGMYEGT